jgi:hypothetical protein
MAADIPLARQFVERVEFGWVRWLVTRRLRGRVRKGDADAFDVGWSRSSN